MTDDETRRALSRLLAEEEADPAWAALRAGRGDEETLRGDPQVAEPRLWQALRSEHEPVAPGQAEADTDLILRSLAHPAPRVPATASSPSGAVQ